MSVMSTIPASSKKVYVSSRNEPISAMEFCAKMTQEGNWTIHLADDPLGRSQYRIGVSLLPPGDVQAGGRASPSHRARLIIPLDLGTPGKTNVILSADRVAADNPDNFAAQVESPSGATAFPAL